MATGVVVRSPTSLAHDLDDPFVLDIRLQDVLPENGLRIPRAGGDGPEEVRAEDVQGRAGVAGGEREEEEAVLGRFGVSLCPRCPRSGWDVVLEMLGRSQSRLRILTSCSRTASSTCAQKSAMTSSFAAFRWRPTASTWRSVPMYDM